MNKTQLQYYLKLIAKLQYSYEVKIAKLYDDELALLLQQIGHMYNKYGQDGIVTREDMMKHNRLQKLENAFIERVKVLSRGQLKLTKQAIREVFAESYYYRAFAIEQKAGYGYFGLLNDEEIEEHVENDMLTDSISDTINSENNYFIKTVKQTLLTGLVAGYAFNKMKDAITERVRIAKGKAVNISQQETQRASEEANLLAMKRVQKAGVPIKKRWLSTLDNRTRKSHRHLDGQEKDIDDYYVSKDGHKALIPRKFGVDAEDINCRCVSIAIIGEISPKERKARDEAGKGTIIEYKNYSEWKNSLK